MVGRVNIIDLKLISYWPCYLRQCIGMNEAFPITTQLSVNSVCFANVILYYKKIPVLLHYF